MRALFFPGGAADESLSGEEDPNVKFYRNQIASKPDGAKIEDIHKNWDGDFERLEMHHGYIQWLFPVFENAGMNWESQPLSKSGAALIRKDPAASRRVTISLSSLPPLLLDVAPGKLLDGHTRANRALCVRRTPH